MSEVIQKIYKQYAESFHNMNIMESELAKKRIETRDLFKELDKNRDDGDGSIGLELSAHAFANISDRLQKLAMENVNVYNDVFNAEKPELSLLWPNNLRAFVLTVMAEAMAKQAIVQKESKNNKGKYEYHYTIKIGKWSEEGGVDLVFTAVVEQCTIKTGFFNWVN